MSVGPERTACPVCGHPLLVEIWTRADTASGRLIDEVVILNPLARGPIQNCPGCGRPVDDVAQSYRTP